MTGQMDLKAVERKAFTATYQDGLQDIFYGLIVAFTAVFMFRPEQGYTILNTVLAVVIILTANVLQWLTKRWVTLPRLGQASFGEIRKRKGRTMAIVLGVFIALQVLLLGVTTLGWFSNSVGGLVDQLFGGVDNGRMTVALLGSLFVGSGMLVLVHFADFGRGYYISILFALAVFLMIYFNRPLLPILIGTGIIIPGVVLLVRFLNSHPLPSQEQPND